MKNQYFGDTRDLFKYDLVLEFLLRGELMSRFTFIPMLTEDQPKYGNHRTNYAKAKAGTGRRELRDFLATCLEEGRRDICELKRFVRCSSLTRGIHLTIYGEGRFFSSQSRDKYFAQTNPDLLKRSVILVDPDIGLEVNGMRGREEQYVRYDEVKLLYDMMDEFSVLLLFQFIPRVERAPYFSKIIMELGKRVTGDNPVYFISDNQIVFFVLAKSPELDRLVNNVLRSYGHRYDLLWGKGSEAGCRL